jgi:putative DNA primase/helicase
MSLAPIARALHGDVYAGGRRANIPFPGHSRHDRSLSLLLDDNNRVIINTFGGGDWKEAADYLIGLGMIDRRRQLSGAGVARGDLRQNPPINPWIRTAVARELWQRGRPVAGTLGEIYARSRGLTRGLPGPSSLRFDRETPLSAYNPAARAVRPALLAAILSPTGKLTAIEITYLKPNGRRDDTLWLPRKQVGVVPPGSAVRLDEVGPRLLVGEGVFTCLSASQVFRFPAWALLTINNMRSWAPPAGVRDVLIAGDRGAPGEAAAARLAARLRSAGLRVEVAFPPNAADWNDELRLRVGAGRGASSVRPRQAAAAMEKGGMEGADAPGGRG